jgi:hypothetical protein
MYGELIAPESRGVERTSGNGRKVVT